MATPLHDEDPEGPLPAVERGRPRRALADLCGRIHPGCRLLRVRRLHGGLDAATHRVGLALPAGGTVTLTLRRYGRRTLTWNPGAPERLWRTLSALAEHEVPAPRPLLSDPTALGGPSLLVSYLPGRPRLGPDDLMANLDGLAELLARVHRVPAELPGLAHLPSPAEQLALYLDAAGRRLGLLGPERAAAERLLRPDRLPAERPSLLHGDYWPGNVLVAAGRPTAVLDWDQAARGDAAYDVAYCRLDLSLVAGGDAPDRFAAAYRRWAGRALSDAELAPWDLLAATRALPDGGGWLPGYQALGRTDLDTGILGERLRGFIARALRRA